MGIECFKCVFDEFHSRAPLWPKLRFKYSVRRLGKFTKNHRSRILCRSLNNSSKYIGANPLRALNIIIAFCFLLLKDSWSHFNVSRSRLGFTSQLACRIILAVWFCNFCSQCFNKTISNDVKGFSIYLVEVQILGGGLALDQVQWYCLITWIFCHTLNKFPEFRDFKQSRKIKVTLVQKCKNTFTAMASYK